MRLHHALWSIVSVVTATISLAAADPPRNGISVGPAKVFDSRSLVIMLEQLEKQLQSINVVEGQKDKLLAALMNFQGARITDVARALSVTGPALPGVTTKETAGEDNALQASERNTTRAAAAPTAPALPTIPSALSMSPSFGAQAEDLLSDQVSLSYQIMNVRMLLERALSDRLNGDNARVQVVLGFQIALNPPSEAKDKAAFVELTIKSASSPVSVVSVMPYEKTYNAYAIDRRSNAFGGAAIAKVINLGYSEQRRSESFYVYKDADTLALGDSTPGAESTEASFGWQFRPVLGRRSVTAGIRQMFAVVALADTDSKDALHALEVSARTSWRKYDAKKSTTSGREDAAETLPLGSVNALTTEAIGSRLRPVVDDVQWRATDDKTAVVRIAGRNFFTGTQVILGSKVYDSPSSGLIFKSDQLLELRTTLGELALGDGAVSGRYGKPVALHPENPQALPGSGIYINDVRHEDEPGRESLDVHVVLQSRDRSALKPPPEQPLIAVGGEIATSVYAQEVKCSPLPIAPVRAPGDDLALRRALTVVGDPRAPRKDAEPEVECWRFTGSIPAAKLHSSSVVSVRYPFRGDRWQATFPIYEAFAISAITNLGTVERKKGSAVTRLAITGRGFTDAWSVILDHEYKKPELQIQSTLIQLEVEADILKNFKSLIVKPGAASPIVQKLPDGKPAPLKPSIAAGQQKSVKKETSVAVTFAGKDLKGVKAAKFDGKALTMEVSDDGKEITVYLTREVTAKAGTATILLDTEDALIPVTVTIES
jgi:hypothetical protein